MCLLYSIVFYVFMFLMISVSSTECLSFKPNDLIISISFADLKWKLPKYCRAVNFKLFQTFWFCWDRQTCDPYATHVLMQSQRCPVLQVCQSARMLSSPSMERPSETEMVRSRAVNYKTCENEKLLKITPQKLRNSFLFLFINPPCYTCPWLKWEKMGEGWNVKKKKALWLISLLAVIEPVMAAVKGLVDAKRGTQGFEQIGFPLGNDCFNSTLVQQEKRSSEAAKQWTFSDSLECREGRGMQSFDKLVSIRTCFSSLAC